MGLGKMMDSTVIFIVMITTLVLSFSPSAYSQPNVTAILSQPAAPFGAFLSILQTSGAIQTLQNQATTSSQGLTIFAPNDVAIAKDPIPWGNLSAAQTVSLCLYHALPTFYDATPSALSALSQLSPVATMAAGAQYTLTVTYVSNPESLSVNSGWTSADVLAAAYLTSPVAVYQINHVLKPEAIFGANIPPPPPSTTSTPSPPPPKLAIPPTSSSTNSTVPSPPPPSSTNSTPSPPPPPPASNSSTPSTTTVTVPPITISHSAAASFRMVGLGGCWARIVLGVLSGGGMIFLLL